jgi:hypothetical protein
MAGHVEMENAPPIVANDKEAIKHTEGDGGHREDRARQNLEEGESKMRR